MNKTCTICKIETPIENFNKKASSKDGYQNVCKTCNAIKSRKYYSDNRKHHIYVIGERNKKYAKIIRDFINEVKKLYGCALCDEKELCCLDFHHIKDKDFLLSQTN